MLPRPYSVFLFALALLAMSVGAQPTGPATTGSAWSELNVQQRSVLAPLQPHWATIDANRRAMWLDLAARYSKMPPEEQQRVQQRMAGWSALSPAERGLARQSFQEAKQLAPEDRQARWEAYQALSPEQRRSLAQGATGPVPQPSADLESSVKRNLVAPAAPTRAEARPVAPTVVQLNPGVSTNLVNRRTAPPVHQQPGMPKIAATPAFVDRQTLLPKRGPQAAVTSAAPASAPR